MSAPQAKDASERFLPHRSATRPLRCCCSLQQVFPGCTLGSVLTVPFCPCIHFLNSVLAKVIYSTRAPVLSLQFATCIPDPTCACQACLELQAWLFDSMDRTSISTPDACLNAELHHYYTELTAAVNVFVVPRLQEADDGRPWLRTEWYVSI